MINKEKIQALNQKFKPDIIRYRQHLHAHPELSFEEKKTSQYIQKILDHHGIKYESGWANTGIVALIGHGKKVVALRADIDALPIKETNKTPYISQNEGVMHACGHDVHTASLLGAAIILKELENDLPITAKLIFQPGEEKIPGGASILINEGVLKKPHVDMIIGQHVHPEMEAGKIGICPGPFMASADELHITVIGKGGHAAMPEQCIDTIMISAEIITALHQITGRYAPKEPTLLTIGKINSTGGATNIIPDEVKMEGTFRAFNEEWRSRAHMLIKKIAEGIATAHGAKCNMTILKGYPYLENNMELTLEIKQRIAEYMGTDNTVNLPKRMTSEDFAFYSHEIPACFYRLGTGNVSRGITSGVHTSTFDVDEEIFNHSSGLMVWIAISTFFEKNEP
ncbi:MAG: M20 family metallopeptidase [Saprospiraceae bacterium]